VLAGEAYFTGTTWFSFTLFGVENGLGLYVFVVGGSTFMTGCSFLELNGALSENGLGNLFLVGGVCMRVCVCVDVRCVCVGGCGSGASRCHLIYMCSAHVDAYE
jgi:hypothetical protein